MRLKTVVPCTWASMPGQVNYPTQVDSSLRQKPNRVTTPCNDMIWYEKVSSELSFRFLENIPVNQVHIVKKA
jgi:hypothetical protein